MSGSSRLEEVGLRLELLAALGVDGLQGGGLLLEFLGGGGGLIKQLGCGGRGGVGARGGGHRAQQPGHRAREGKRPRRLERRAAVDVRPRGGRRARGRGHPVWREGRRRQSRETAATATGARPRGGRRDPRRARGKRKQRNLSGRYHIGGKANRLRLIN